MGSLSVYGPLPRVLLESSSQMASCLQKHWESRNFVRSPAAMRVSSAVLVLRGRAPRSAKVRDFELLRRHSCVSGRSLLVSCFNSLVALKFFVASTGRSGRSHAQGIFGGGNEAVQKTPLRSHQACIHATCKTPGSYAVHRENNNQLTSSLIRPHPFRNAGNTSMLEPGPRAPEAAATQLHTGQLLCCPFLMWLCGEGPSTAQPSVPGLEMHKRPSTPHYSRLPKSPDAASGKKQTTRALC